MSLVLRFIGGIALILISVTAVIIGFLGFAAIIVVILRAVGAP